MKRGDFFKVIGYSVFTLAIVLVTIALLGPFNSEEASIRINDKVMHFLVFYILTCMGLCIFQHIRKFDILVLLLGYATLSELLQMFVGRDCSFYDWYADAMGIVSAVIPLYSRNMQAHKNPERRVRPW